VRLAVLASGSGTILQAMIDAELPIVVVVSDRRCRALDVASVADLPAVLVERRSFGADFDRLAYTHEVIDALEPYAPDWVAMAGFMTVLDKPMVDRYAGRVLNTHPSLLPAFRGAHPVADALAFGVKVTGCTVHVATEALDDGPILAQEAVAVLPGDTVESLHERIKAVERRLYIQTIDDLRSLT